MYLDLLVLLGGLPACSVAVTLYYRRPDDNPFVHVIDAVAEEIELSFVLSLSVY